MKVVLNIYTKPCIKGGVQYCNTPEGFESIKDLHPEDEFVCENEDSWDAYKLFLEFTEFMGFNSREFFAAMQYNNSLRDNI